MEVATALAPVTIEPFLSQKTGPVEPVLTPGHLANKMQYQTDAAQLARHITQIILTSPEPETVLSSIADVLGKCFHADTCLIVTGVSQQFTQQVGYWCERNDRLPAPQHSLQLLEHPALAAVLADSSLLAISDVREDQIWSSVGLPWEIMPIRAVLGISTWLHSTANGVIVVGRNQPSDWTDGEKELLKSVSDQMAIAISQVQLQQRVSTATRYQTLIHPITLALQSGREIEQILQMVMQETTQAFAIDQGFILLLKYANPLIAKRRTDEAPRQNEKFVDPGSTTLNLSKRQLPKAKAVVVCECPSISKDSEEKRRSPKTGGYEPDNSRVISKLNISFWLSECPLCEQAFMNAPEPTVITGSKNDPFLKSDGGIAQLSPQDAMPAILVVTLESQGTLLGFLVLQHHQPRFWHQQELELMKWVGAQASTAIIQTQTLRQIQAVVEERTSQLQRSLEVQAKLYEKTRQQIDQLRHLNQLKDEFLATVSHELKTPLTKMSVAIELLRQPGLPPALCTKYTDILKQQCTHEINLINDLLTLQNLESHKQPIQLQKIDLKQLILELAATFQKQWVDKGLNLVVDLPKRDTRLAEPTLMAPANPSLQESKGKRYTNLSAVADGTSMRGAQSAYAKRSLMVQTDPDSLNRVLMELLTNAGKYSDPDSIVRLRVIQQVSQEVSQIVLTLSNIGPGISPTEITYIFDKFRRGQGVTEQAVQGTGLGLALVKSLVQHLNGTIDVESSPTGNSPSCETCFTLTLPQFFEEERFT